MSVLFKESFYAKDYEDYEKNNWKKHPDEASEAYDYFIRYFVSSDRSIDGYRLFLFDKGLVEEDELKNIKKPSTKFTNYEKGWSQSGKQITGLHSFVKRKESFNKTGIKPPPRIFTTSIDDLKKLRVSIVRQELLDADILEEQWLIQVAAFQKHVQDQKTKKESAHGQNSMVLSSLTKSRRDISFLKRRAAGMTDKATEEIVEEAAQEEIEITYTEIEINTEQFEQIDYSTLESFEEIIAMSPEDMEKVLDRLESREEKNEENS